MRISACVITKNEQNNLPLCMDSVKDIVNEIVVVDTGSTDRTVEVAKQFGARVYFYEWDNDFSKTRNFAISKARGDWIIFLDADEYIAEESRSRLKQIIKESSKTKNDSIWSMMTHYDLVKKGAINSNLTIRIFRKDKDILYTGAIHERLVHKKRTLTSLDLSSYISIIHTGYSSDVNKEMKSDRNLDILQKELINKPNDSTVLFYMSESYISVKNFELGLEFANKVIKYSNSDLYGIYQKNYLNIIECMGVLLYSRDEIYQIITEAIKKYPNFPDFQIYLADTYLEDTRYHDAIEAYNIGLKNLSHSNESQSRMTAILPKIVCILGELYYKNGQINKSLDTFTHRLTEDPYDYLCLKKLLLVLTRTTAFDKTIQLINSIYDDTKYKDAVYLLKASIDAKNSDLAEYIFFKLPVVQQKELQREYNCILLMKGNFNEATIEFEKLYFETNNSQDALNWIAASFLSQNIKSMNINNDFPLKNVFEKISSEETSLTNDEQLDLLNIVNLISKLGKGTELLKRLEWFNNLGLSRQIAEILYYHENYTIVPEFLNAYLENKEDLLPAELADVLFKMADSYYNDGQFELALSFLIDAQKNNPNYYRSYELIIHISSSLKKSEYTKKFVELGLEYFPDSNFLKYYCEKE